MKPEVVVQVVFGPASEVRVAGVAGVLQDRRDGGGVPAVAGTVPVLLGAMRRRAGNVVAVEFGGYGLVSATIEVGAEDALHGRRSGRID